MKDSLGLLSRDAQRRLYQLKPAAFLERTDSIAGIYNDFYQQYFQSAEARPSTTFEQYEKASIDYLFYRIKESYPLFHKRLTRGQTPALPEGYYDYRQKADFDNPALLNVPSYRGYAKTYLNMQARKAKRNKNAAEQSESQIYLDIVKAKFKSDSVKAHVLGELLLQKVQRSGLSDLEEALAYYEELPQRPKLRQKLKQVKQSWQALKPGKKAPGFAYPNVEGKTVRLSDLRGSYVYIDAWATWCGPCIKEIPHLKELHEQLNNENVKFVSISLDKASDKQKWRKMVKNKELKGVQLFANGEEFEAKLAQDYVINSIPRFILIGPEGKIIDANAERPSGNIKSRLESLMAQS